MQEEDSAWKEILEECFKAFLEFFFPGIHDQVDWKVEPEWLDKEFQAIFRDQEDGRRYVDKLAKVVLLDGLEEWMLIHVEVQGQSEAEFNFRMLRYNFLIEMRYQKEVLSLAVLTDEANSFRPGLYLKRKRGVVHLFRFPVVKLLDYETRRAELEASKNPFSVVVLAHLDSRKATSDGERFEVKFQLARRLYEKGFEWDDIRRLYRFIDWILRLPDDLEFLLLDKIETEFQGKSAMPYIARFEQIAMEKGREEGLREAVRLGLKLRFGDEGLSLLPIVNAITDVARLRSVVQALERVERLDDIKGILMEV